jgi:LPXTG-motif cell wall-anchored protein
MRIRLRLGAAVAVGLGALLLATALASPALAWRSTVKAEAKCLDDGRIRVDYTVTAWEEGHKAYVKVYYMLDGEKFDLDSGEFNEEQSSFSDSFVLDAGTTGTVVVHAKAFWKDDEKPSHNESKPVELPEDCEGGESSSSTSESTTSTSESTTTTSESTTTTAPSTTESSVAPTTSIEETTTTAAVGAATSTTAGGQLPFTGAGSSQPMLLAGIALVAGGGLFLLLSRNRGTVE